MGWCVRPAGVRQDNRKTKKISWSIKESDFARLMSFPSSSRRERSSMMVSSGPLEKGMEMGDGRDGDVSPNLSMSYRVPRHVVELTRV